MAAARTRSDYKALTGSERVASLLLAIGEEQTAKIFALMDEDEIKEISQTMSRLGAVDSGVVERLFTEFAEQVITTGSLVGTYESTERLLTKVLDKNKVESIMEEIRGPAGRTMWDKLNNVSEEVLASYLKNEYPQTVAVVLSKIKSAQAARVLAQLPEAYAMEVVQRMLRMETVQKDVLEGIERTLRSEFMSNLARTNRRDSHEMMAALFNNLDRSTEARFMKALEERNQEAAEKIKSLMFTFDDLSRLDAGAVQTLLRTIDKQKLAVALKGASETLRDLFFNNMSERARKLLKEDIAALGPVRMRDVDEAQGYMVTTAKELAAKGEIVIAQSASSDDELVY